MSGWYALDPRPTSPIQHLYRAWNALGTYQLAPVDPRSHSPVYVGRAVRRVLDQHPEWTNRLQIEIYGNTYPHDVIERVLRRYDLQDIVRVHGRIPHRAVHETIRRAHLLFLTLPDRLDGSAGGRISLKTYEYLTTNRPILAALPRGENRTVLDSKTGTYLAEPKDVETMAHHISILADKHFAGENISTDRSVLQANLSSRRRAQQLHTILSEATGRTASSRWSIPEQVEDRIRSHYS
jgi:glycosyltransferase involved in cell wall biosynthesis